MPADRLYYTHPSLQTFDGVIIAQQQSEGVWHTFLDRTAFYPTSGGQLFDTGQINGVDIHDVIVTEAGDIAHLSKLPVGEIGEMAHGVIDSSRRRMHRQQHTAQHILSYALAKLYSLETVSVHLGEEYGAVELDTTAVSASQLAEAERLTREIIAENSEIVILFVSSDDASKLPLRKAPVREGTIRIIRIGEHDWSACGGTHCDCTAEVGSFTILGASKIRGRTLVTFLAGDQLLTDYQLRRTVTSDLSERFTCGIVDLSANISKLVDESRDLRKQLDVANNELVLYRAEKRAEHAIRCGAYNLYIGSDNGMDPKLAGVYASRIAERISGVVVLTSNSRAIISCVPQSGCKAGEIARAICAGTGGRGGGNDASAQVGNIPAEKTTEVNAIVTAFLTKI